MVSTKTRLTAELATSKTIGSNRHAKLRYQFTPTTTTEQSGVVEADHAYLEALFLHIASENGLVEEEIGG